MNGGMIIVYQFLNRQFDPAINIIPIYCRSIWEVCLVIICEKIKLACQTGGMNGKIFSLKDVI